MSRDQHFTRFEFSPHSHETESAFASALNVSAHNSDQERAEVELTFAVNQHNIDRNRLAAQVQAFEARWQIALVASDVLFCERKGQSITAIGLFDRRFRSTSWWHASILMTEADLGTARAPSHTPVAPPIG